MVGLIFVDMRIVYHFAWKIEKQRKNKNFIEVYVTPVYLNVKI